MELFSKNWQCAKCGKKYWRNRTKCKNCGHTVFVRPD